MIFVTDSYVSYRRYCNEHNLNPLRHGWAGDAKQLRGKEDEALVFIAGHERLSEDAVRHILNYGRIHRCLIVMPKPA
jgi:hypothetical protein